MKAKILHANPETIRHAAAAICRGEVVGMPTETVYGLAGNCWMPKALTRIFEAKNRPFFDPLIVHVNLDVSHGNGLAQLEALKLIDRSRISPLQENSINQLIDYFWHSCPSPLTLVLPKHPDVPELVTGGLSTVAIRMPFHPVAQALISQAGVPLAAPSANRFGKISPTSASAVAEELGEKLEIILDGGPSQIGIESTVIAFPNTGEDTGEIHLLRPGGAAREEIERVLKKTLTIPPATPTQQASPGMLLSHYAPTKPLYLLETKVSELGFEDIQELKTRLNSIPSQDTIGLLLISGDCTSLSKRFSSLMERPVIARVLSPTHNPEEIAQRLFAEMRWLDSANIAAIFAEGYFRNTGLELAMGDRLKRASAKSTLPLP